MYAHDIIAAHPHVQGSTNETLIRCIEDCFACAQACTACADACLGEDMVADLAPCIRLNLDCADICIAAGKIASRRTGSDIDIILATLQACRIACLACAEECEQHSRMHEHCAICAEACRQCARACHEAFVSVQ